MFLDNGWLFLCWEPTVHSQKIPGAGYLPACCLHTLFPSPLSFPVSSKASTQAQEIIMMTTGHVLVQAAASEWRTTSGLPSVKWLGGDRTHTEMGSRPGLAPASCSFVSISSLGLVKPSANNLNSLSFCSESFCLWSESTRNQVGIRWSLINLAAPSFCGQKEDNNAIQWHLHHAEFPTEPHSLKSLHSVPLKVGYFFLNTVTTAWLNACVFYLLRSWWAYLT